MLAVFAILILSFLVSFIGPWWAFGIVAFAVPFFQPLTGKKAFWSGFSAVALLWLVQCLLQSLPNDNRLAGRIADMLFVQHWAVLLLVTAAIGGLLAGLAALSGQRVAALLKRDAALQNINQL